MKREWFNMYLSGRCVGPSLSVLILTLLVSTASASEWRERITNLKNAELRALQSCRPPAPCPVFFVSALDGVLPIPTRYLLVSGPGSASLTFTSPAGILPGHALDYLSGTLSIGPRAELERKRASGEIKLDPVTEIDQVAVFRVQPISKSSSVSPEVRTEIFILIGGEDYVFIADENDDLAQALLQLRVRAKSWKK